MKAKAATFITSATRPAHYPPPTLPEFAFAGRSNVGKSSLINMLVGVSNLARTSNTPGRTQLLNWFRIETGSATFAFVDLPGYGYAKVPHAIRDNWRPMVESYLTQREVLRAVIVLIDARRGAESEEHDLVDWLKAEQIRAQVVLTKTDKIAKAKRKPMAVQVRRELGLSRDPVMTSAHNGEGLADMWRFITSLV